MDFGLILKRLEALETDLEVLYERFAVLSQSDPSVETTFRGLAHEEHLHADLIRYQFRVFHKNKGQFRDIEIDTSEITRLVERVKQMKEATSSTEEALEAAYEIENSAAEHYYVLAGVQSNPELKNLLKAMAAGCTEHHARLARFFTETGLEVKTDKDFFDIEVKDE